MKKKKPQSQKNRNKAYSPLEKQKSPQLSPIDEIYREEIGGPGIEFGDRISIFCLKLLLMQCNQENKERIRGKT